MAPPMPTTRPDAARLRRAPQRRHLLTLSALLLIAAAPMNLGEGVTSLSFAMFYNRLGWALLATLLVMALPPKRPAPRQLWPDALSAAFLVGTMLYLKISYGLVGLAFLAILLTAPAQRALAALSLIVTAAAILVVEAVWGSSAAHLADIALAGPETEASMLLAPPPAVSRSPGSWPCAG